MRCSRELAIVVALGLAASCTGDGASPARVPGYIANSPCTELSDESACATAGCEWIDLGAPCPLEGGDCPTGVCQPVNPCLDHKDADSCLADTADNCDWAAVELCIGESCGPDGFCYQQTDECVCACPLYCPEGENCPPCDCDCGGGSGGGGTCTCACPECPPGEICPPCSCECVDDGCTGGDTCTCACPECPPGEDCAPCDCSCDGGGVNGSTGSGTTETCVCPDCPPNTECGPCDCGSTDPSAPTAPDPCNDHVDETTCLEDSANECTWYAIGAPCELDQPCPGGVCQKQSTDGGGDCTCACPDCGPNEICPPCECSCNDECVVYPEPGIYEL